MDLLLPTALKNLWAIACFLIPGISKSYLDFMKVAPAERNEDHYRSVAVRLRRLYLVKIYSEKNSGFKGYHRIKRQLQECLAKIYFGKEHLCSRTLLYSRDLLRICSWIRERKISRHCSARINKWSRSDFAFFLQVLQRA